MNGSSILRKHGFKRRELASVDKLTRISQPSMETVNNKLNNTLKQNQKLNAEASAFTLKKMLKIVPEDNLVQDRNQITNNDSYLNNAERYLPEPSIDGLKKNESHGWNYKTDGQIDGHSVSKLNHVLNTEEQQEKITMVMALETFYRQKGFKNPKYCYIHLSDNKGNKVYCAELILPNGRTLRGEPKNSYSEASEDLAFCALNIVQDMKLHQNDHLRDLVAPSSSSLYADPKPTPHIEPPVHWQLNRNTVSNEFPANPAPNTYFQPQQYTPNTSNDVSMNEQYMTNDRITIPSPSSAFTSAANPSDQFMSNRKVKVAANFNTSQS